MVLAKKIVRALVPTGRIDTIAYKW